MVLQDYKIDGEYICISKKELERKMEQYLSEAYKNLTDYGEGHSKGKADFCRNLLALLRRTDYEDVDSKK